MAWSPWVIALLVLYPLVQVPLVFWLGRRFELEGDAPLPTPTRRFWTGEAPAGAGRRTARPPGECRRCGARNDPGYAFCGTCLARL